MSIRILLISILLNISVIQTANAQGDMAGSACVVAKQQGDSQDIEWSIAQPSVSIAIETAKDALRKRGHEYVFPQANSSIPHGWLVAIKSRFTTFSGRQRISYGCGFSEKSVKEAEELAVVDLQSYSWGWHADHGYEVIKTLKY